MLEGNWKVYDEKEHVSTEGEIVIVTVTFGEKVKKFTAEWKNEGGGSVSLKLGDPIVDVVDVTVTKTWDVPEGTVLPEAVEVVLLANGELTGDPVEISADENGVWEYTFEGVDKYDEKFNEITYSVKEAGEQNGEVTINDKEYTVTYGTDNNGLTITNTLVVEEPPVVEPEKTSVTVTKTWEGVAENAELPAVTVELYADTQETGNTASLTAEGQWTYTFEDLDKCTKDGEDIVYTVKELGVDENGFIELGEDMYKVTYDGFTITNKLVVEEPPVDPPVDPPAEPEKINVTVTKVWDVPAGTNLPEVVQVVLLADTQETGNTASLTAEGQWTYTFEGLLKYSANDKEIVYTVQEVGEQGGKIELGNKEYTVTYNGLTVTNKLVVEEPSHDDPEPRHRPSRKPDPKPVEVIEEVEVPLEEVPVVEVPVEETPLADAPLAAVPATSDAALLWLAVSALSGCGVLSLKKREEEEN